MKRTTLSVKQMQKLLEKQHNRTLTDRWQSLHRQMASGEWNADVSPIILFDDGTLADGQHRIRAAVEMNQPFTCWVVTITKSDITKVDAGRTRTTRDHCRMMGLPIQSIHCAAARAIRWLIDQEWEVAKVYSHDEIIQTANTYNVTELPTAASELRCASVFLAVWAYTRHHFGRDADDFFGAVNSGEGLRAGMPALALRRRLLQSVNHVAGSGAQRASYLWLNVRAWNFWVDGDSVMRLQLPDKTTPLRPNTARTVASFLASTASRQGALSA